MTLQEGEDQASGMYAELISWEDSTQDMRTNRRIQGIDCFLPVMVYT